ncbi:uncharacterized protein F5Z01DRAFT_643186 [Emericellopsis atlantica]|uniref:Uncharacterized protein n=1 Tax=Emericellopsis atlantica TaxID=2614577 RepID=A0A9P7ZUB9_9HYPO|nr:uncharacterized protein F5Z01DRAFT_643186 [Emericellopsis atlantica]KAG9258415.1 hypothetical protein F5Z01DRAFT_643186 [Emericellopsis atlantica]
MATSNNRIHEDIDPVPQPPAQAHTVAGGRGDENEAPAATADGPSEAAAQDDVSSASDHVQEKGTTPKLTKWQKMKAHFRKFWWAYLIGLIILLAILLPVFFKVIIPAIVQNIVSGQKLPISHGNIRALSPTQLNVSLVTTMDTPLPATINEFDLSLYNKEAGPDKAFLSLQLPKQKVNGKTELDVAQQTQNITNYDELVKWFNGVFDLKEVPVSVYGKPKVSLGALEYHPKLDKELKVPALNYLDGFGIDTLRLQLPPAENGYNLKGKLNLPNQGVLTLFLGNLTFNLKSGDLTLGYINIYDVEMKPGMNTPDFDGELYLKELVPNLATILDDQKAALSEGAIEFNATGNATRVNGQRIPYVEEVLAAKKIRARIPVIALIADVLNGFLSDDGSSLSELAGDVFGNQTLFDNILEHWGDDNPTGNGTALNSTTAALVREKLRKRSSWGSMALNVMRLGARTKKHHK